MKIRRMRNNVKLSDVVLQPDGRRYGFGVVLDGKQEPSFVFFPSHICVQYELGKEDAGLVFDCVFREEPRRDKERHKDPVVMMIYEDTDPVKDTIVIDEFDDGSEPEEGDGLPDFIARQQQTKQEKEHQ